MNINGTEAETLESLSRKATSPAHYTRLLSRHNLITDTSGHAPTYVQANLLILPEKHASAFHDLCLRNPVPCPLLAITSPGNPHQLLPISLPSLKSAAENNENSCFDHDFDIRTDFPSYRVYENGQLKSTNVRDLLSLWKNDHVGFLIGCSYSFEDALAKAGLPPRQFETNTTVAMYRTNIPLLPAGIFTNACCIVSMRPYPASDIEAVRAITSTFLATHGEPVAWGWDAVHKLGIRDIAVPDFGSPQLMREGDVPVFWVCIIIYFLVL